MGQRAVKKGPGDPRRSQKNCTHLSLFYRDSRFNQWLILTYLGTVYFLLLGVYEAKKVKNICSRDRGGDFTKSHIQFFAFLVLNKFTGKAVGSKQSSLGARLGFKRHFLSDLFHSTKLVLI